MYMYMISPLGNNESQLVNALMDILPLLIISNERERGREGGREREREGGR